MPTFLKEGNAPVRSSKPIQRGFSILKLKVADDDKRILEGIATTPTPDRANDIVELDGLEYQLPMPFLYFHNPREPIGLIEVAKKTADGLFIRVRIAAAGLIEEVDKAWSYIKAGLVPGLSIGFRPLEEAYISETGGWHYLRSELVEVSAVSIPMNAEATITNIKSAYASSRSAALGTDRVVRLGVPSSKTPVGASTHTAGVSMPKATVAEQITSFEARLVSSNSRRSELMQKTMDDGRTMTDAEREEDDTLKKEIADVRDHITRLKEFEQDSIAAATRVTPDAGKSPDAAAANRGGGAASQVVVRGSNLPKGTRFTRFAMAIAASHGNRLEAAEHAKRWKDSTPEVEMVLRAAMTAGTVQDSDWAAPLVQYQNMADEFVELLRPQTILGKIAGIRRVPFNIKLPTQTQSSTVGWVGEGAPKPVSELKFGQLTLGMAKAAGIVVLSEELVRSSQPSAEEIVRADLIATMAQFLDKQFIDPSVAAVANVSPASITYGVTPIVASGTSADAVRLDVSKAFGAYIAANLSPATATWIMPATVAMRLAMLMNAMGNREFPDLSINGGTFFGLPVVVSENIPANAGSGSPVTGTGSRIILVNASDILLADDGQVTIDASREASLQMDSAPTNPPTASTVFVSLWQMNLVGLRAERYINWVRRRTEAVQMIDVVNYV